MRILGIESSSLVASVAVVENEILMAEYTTNFKKTHSQTLLPMIDEMLNMLEIELNSVDAIAVSGGPGSFTGLRIGAATAKGLAYALTKPLIHIPTVDAMAYNFFGSADLICPIMDARRNQVYTGLYQFREQFAVVKEQYPVEIAELIATLNQMGQDVVFLGDGVPAYQEIIEKEMTVKFRFAPAHLNRQRAGAVAALGSQYYRLGKQQPAETFRVDYLRKSQAERERGI